MPDVSVYEAITISEDVDILCTDVLEVSVYDSIAVAETVLRSDGLRVDARADKKPKAPPGQLKSKTGERLNLAEVSPAYELVSLTGGVAEANAPNAELTATLDSLYAGVGTLEQQAPTPELYAEIGSALVEEAPVASLVSVSYSNHMSIDTYAPLARLTATLDETETSSLSRRIPTGKRSKGTLYCSSVELDSIGLMWFGVGSIITDATEGLDATAPVSKIAFENATMFDTSINGSATAPASVGFAEAAGMQGNITESGYFTDYVLQHSRW